MGGGRSRGTLQKTFKTKALRPSPLCDSNFRKKEKTLRVERSDWSLSKCGALKYKVFLMFGHEFRKNTYRCQKKRIQ